MEQNLIKNAFYRSKYGAVVQFIATHDKNIFHNTTVILTPVENCEVFRLYVGDSPNLHPEVKKGRFGMSVEAFFNVHKFKLINEDDINLDINYLIN